MQPTAKCKQKKRQCVSKNQELFVTVAVLSLGKLCEDIGYSYHWTSGQKPQLIKDGRRIKCSTANCEPIVVLGLSTSSSSCTYISNIIIAASLGSCTASRINKKVRAQVALRENGETRRVNQKKNRNQNKKKTTRGHGEKPVAWFARMVRRIYGESCGWKCSRTQGRTREFFSWISFRAASKSGIGQAQY